MKKTNFDSFKAFYPYYLNEHSHPVCRAIHYVGSTLVLIILVYCGVMQATKPLIALPFVGYGFAWVGHFFFEHNKPATFKYPLYSFIGDWVMYAQWWRSLFAKKR